MNECIICNCNNEISYFYCSNLKCSENNYCCKECWVKIMKDNKYNTLCFICKHQWSYNKYSIYKAISELTHILETLLIKINDLLIALIFIFCFWSSGFIPCSLISFIVFGINPYGLLNNFPFFTASVYTGIYIYSKCILNN